MEEGKLKDQTQIDVIKILADCQELKETTGIDLATLLKFLTATKCFWLDGDGYVSEYVIWGVCKEGVLAVPSQCPYGDCMDTFEYKDYGNTWALTKEELL